MIVQRMRMREILIELKRLGAFTVVGGPWVSVNEGYFGDLTDNAAAIWLAFNHGLHISELCDLRWQDIQWQERRVMVRRLKGSQFGEHPLTEQDKRFLKPLRTPGLRPSDRVFGMEPAAFRRMLYRLKLPPELAALKPHPHMLRHACGFDLVGRADLQARAAFMGHKRLENTVRYSRLAPEQFEGLRS